MLESVIVSIAGNVIVMSSYGTINEHFNVCVLYMRDKQNIRWILPPTAQEARKHKSYLETAQRNAANCLRFA